MHRLPRPMLIAAALYTVAGGYIHIREWLDGYRAVPASAPGSAMVRIGFPLNAGLSLVLAAVLVVAAIRLPRLIVPAALATFAFQAASLAFLIGSRLGTVLGWTEPVWTTAAEQARAVEIGALVTLVVAVLLYRYGSPARPAVLKPAPVRADTVR